MYSSSCDTYKIRDVHSYNTSEKQKKKRTFWWINSYCTSI